MTRAYHGESAGEQHVVVGGEQRVHQRLEKIAVAMGIENMLKIEKDQALINARRTRPKGIQGS